MAKLVSSSRRRPKLSARPLLMSVIQTKSLCSSHRMHVPRLSKLMATLFAHRWWEIPLSHGGYCGPSPLSMLSLGLDTRENNGWRSAPRPPSSSFVIPSMAPARAGSLDSDNLVTKKGRSLGFRQKRMKRDRTKNRLRTCGRRLVLAAGPGLLGLEIN